MAVRPPGVTGEVAKKGKAKNDSTQKDLGPGSLAGNLTKEPELRFTPSGIAVVQMRVAVADRRKDDRTGQWTESPTEYFTVQAWRKLAENCAEHLAKGCRIIAEGQWKSDHWTDKDGQDQERVYLAATEVGASLLFTGVRILEPERRQRS
ncbi:MAG TPA: single-stranded DNA-binding protein [Streptosporangiaceae bacterium]|nr:single-stranded DNA-binding protein [Streptosporangiaceae bacterium]